MTIAYKITIYSGNSSLVFNNADIISLSCDDQVSVLGDELPVGSFEPVILYDGSETDIIGIPYGSKVRFDIDYAGTGATVYWGGYYYIETIERVARNQYKLNCVTKVGLWDVQYTTGGLFNGETLSTVVSGVMGDADLSVHSSASDIKIYGWLPYCSKRDALQQLLFATGAYLYSTINGYSIRIPYSDGEVIAAADIYMAGSVEYPKRLSKVTVTEHGFYYLPSQPSVELFDNTEGYPAVNQLVVFPTSPIYIPSVSATDGLAVSNVTVNTCTVSGNGKLTGIPYAHKLYDVIKTNPDSSAIDKEVSVSDATLVSIANSEAVAQRIYDYYSQAKVNHIDFKYFQKTCGRYYSFTNVFSAADYGCLAKIKKVFSSIIRATSEFISGYAPTGENTGNRFSRYSVLTSSGTWYRPSGVTKIRVVLIGGGSGGSSGTAGQDGSTEYSGRGGAGGKAGTAGKGGKIFQTTIDNPSAQYSYSCGAGGAGGSLCSDHETPNAGTAGGTTTFGSFSSANGIYSDTGFCDTFSGVIYALPGTEGVDGADGGDGGSNNTGIGTDNERNGGDGGDVVSVTGTVYKGGAGGQGALYQSERVPDKRFAAGGAGGNGACATQAGSDGSSGSVVKDWDDGIGEMNISTGGDGSQTRSTPTNRSAATVKGQGGDAGHGGGGGGAAGAETSDIYWYNTVNYVICSPNGRQTDGLGGYGGAGGKGADGCIIVYY